MNIIYTSGPFLNKFYDSKPRIETTKYIKNVTGGWGKENIWEEI